MQRQSRTETMAACCSLRQIMRCTALGRLVLTIPFSHYLNPMLAALDCIVYGYWILSGRAKRNCLCVVSFKAHLSLLSHFTGYFNPWESQPNHLTPSAVRLRERPLKNSHVRLKSSLLEFFRNSLINTRVFPLLSYIFLTSLILILMLTGITYKSQGAKRARHNDMNTHLDRIFRHHEPVTQIYRHNTRSVVSTQTCRRLWKTLCHALHGPFTISRLQHAETRKRRGVYLAPTSGSLDPVTGK